MLEQNMSLPPQILIIGTFLMSGCLEYKLEQELNADPGSLLRYASDDKAIDGLAPPGACEDEDNIAIELSVNESCFQEHVFGSLDAVVEWSISEFTEYPEYGQTVMAPVIGQLTDDNFDGVIDSTDTPDIVIVSDDGGYIDHRHGVLRLISGDGVEINAINRKNQNNMQVYPYRYGNAALGDIDNDGLPDIVTLATVILTAEPQEPDSGAPPDTVLEPAEGAPPDSGMTGLDSGDGDNPIRPLPPNVPEENMEDMANCHLAAYDNALNLKWVSDPLDDECGGHAPAIADLEGDGTVDIVVGPYIINGFDGLMMAKGSADTGRFAAYTELGFNSVVSDLDADGIQEIIAGRTVYKPDGTVKCQGTGPYDGFSAVADMDMDGAGEFIVVGNQTVTLYDTDCSTITSWSLQGGGTGGPPTIADYDGDSVPEIGFVDASTYSVYEVDGQVMWSTPVTDMSSHATGSVVFDFEGDGYPEVVYGDELTLWVFDGASGAIRLMDQAHNSRTLHEFPTIADIDNDGSAEIVVVNGGSHYDNTSTGLFVIGSQSNGWQAGRQVWNQHAYSITNVNDDLSIPAIPMSNWPNYNNFRSGDVNPASGGQAPDAVPLAEVCTLECYLGDIIIHVKIANQGVASLRNGLPVTVYSYENEEMAPLQTQLISQIVPAGMLSESIRFRIPKEDVIDDRLFVSVDQPNFTAECVEDNNLILLENVSCD